jgi:hypothetical protein
VQIQLAPALDVTGAAFTACPGSNGTACTVGSLSLSQSDEVDASVNVGSQALGGEEVQLTATVSATGAHGASASATVAVITPTPSDPTGLLGSGASSATAISGGSRTSRSG